MFLCKFDISVSYGATLIALPHTKKNRLHLQRKVLLLILDLYGAH